MEKHKVLIYIVSYVLYVHINVCTYVWKRIKNKKQGIFETFVSIKESSHRKNEFKKR